MNKNIISILVVAIIVGGGAFFGGMKYQQSQTANNFKNRQFGNVNGTGNFVGRNGQGRGTGSNGMGFRPVTGSILSVDNGSISIKMQDGSSKIVLLPNSATVTKTDAAPLSDLKEGETVAVIGVTNSDGSVTAQNVQINPMFRNATGSGITK